MSVSDHTLDRLLDHLQDQDLPTILARSTGALIIIITVFKNTEIELKVSLVLDG